MAKEEHCVVVVHPNGDLRTFPKRSTYNWGSSIARYRWRMQLAIDGKKNEHPIEYKKGQEWRKGAWHLAVGKCRQYPSHDALKQQQKARRKKQNAKVGEKKLLNIAQIWNVLRKDKIFN